MSTLFDPRQVRRAFARAAAGYAQAATLQREVEARLLESLDALDGRVPQVVLDVGSGPAHAADAMRRRWPHANVFAIDAALPMLQQARPGRWWPRRAPLARLCADARALPLADGSVDVLFSSLCLQWVDDLPTVFAGFRRVLKPGGLLLCSTFGPDTLHQLRTAFAAADDVAHVSPFASMPQFGDALLHAGFRDPVLHRDVFELAYPDLPALMRELRALGATNALRQRRRTLTGPGRMRAAAAAYETLLDDARIPATWEVIYARAFAPPAGQPIRSGDDEIASMPLAQIPIRRR